MFLQACVIHSVQQGGRCSIPKVSGQHFPPPLGPGHNTSLPPGTRSQHLPPWDQVTTPPSPPPRGAMRRWAVRILLECILVLLMFVCPHGREGASQHALEQWGVDRLCVWMGGGGVDRKWMDKETDGVYLMCGQGAYTPPTIWPLTWSLCILLECILVIDKYYMIKAYTRHDLY